MPESLYERLGGTQGITQLASDIFDIHLDNPRIATRYAQSDVSAVKDRVAKFFIAGTGGPDEYEGKDMLGTHKGMNIDEGEFMAVLDDALIAMQKLKIQQREQEEVLFVLYSMRGDIVRV